MTSLTQTSISARKIIRYGVYLSILGVIVKYSIVAGIALYKKFFPEPPPAPTVAFGKLPKMPFPYKEYPFSEIKYTLETPSGDLPVLIDQLPVYHMPSFSTNIKALEDAKNKAKSLGFSVTGENIIKNIPNVFIFKKDNAPSLLTMNIISGIFSISYDLSANPSVLIRRPQDVNSIKNMYITMLNKIGSPTDQLQGDSINQLLKVDAGKFNEAIALSDANFVKTNLFRKKIIYREIEFSSVTPNYPESNVWMMSNGETIVGAEYHFFAIDYEKSATYPIKQATTAWEELNSGKGYIANFGNNTKNEIVIRRVYLAYYDSGQYAQYFQPVVVFEGDGGFYAYVPAITDEYYGAE